MFKLLKNDYGSNNVGETELMPATNSVAYKKHMALAISSGAMVIASGDVTATHICLEDKTGASGGTVLCYPISNGMIFETKLQGYSATTQKPGLSVTFHTDGLQITSTAAVMAAATTSTTLAAKGAYIVDMCSASAAGDKVRVRLLR